VTAASPKPGPKGRRVVSRGAGGGAAVCATSWPGGIVHWARRCWCQPDLRGSTSAGARSSTTRWSRCRPAHRSGGWTGSGSLEVRFLARRDVHLSFALVSDFRARPAREGETDDALLSQAWTGIGPEREVRDPRRCRRLLPVPPPGGGITRRVDGMGRKRGKLGAHAALRWGRVRPIVSDLQRLRGVSTSSLDSDAAAARDSARQLVGTIAHPLNRPSTTRVGRVTRGYSILQPRWPSPWPAPASPLRAPLRRRSGIDPPTRAVSDGAGPLR
jgi:hypothetical protein